MWARLSIFSKCLPSSWYIFCYYIAHTNDTNCSRRKKRRRNDLQNTTNYDEMYEGNNGREEVLRIVGHNEATFILDRSITAFLLHIRNPIANSFSHFGAQLWRQVKIFIACLARCIVRWCSVFTLDQHHIFFTTHKQKGSFQQCLAWKVIRQHVSMSRQNSIRVAGGPIAIVLPGFIPKGQANRWRLTP